VAAAAPTSVASAVSHGQEARGGVGVLLDCDLKRGSNAGKKVLARWRPMAFKGRRSGVERWWGPDSVRRHTKEEQGVQSDQREALGWKWPRASSVGSIGAVA
jgi:hypothetical protein